MSFFLELRPRVAKIWHLNESMGHPISWGNGIILPYIYLVEPISEALHFWSTFRPWYNLRRAHSALQLSKHCFVFFSPWELLPPTSPQGERSRASCVSWVLMWEAGKASSPSWLMCRGNTTYDAAQDLELILYLDLFTVCLLPFSFTNLWASLWPDWNKPFSRCFPNFLRGMLVAPCWRALRSGWEHPSESKACRRALQPQRAQPSSSC